MSSSNKERSSPPAAGVDVTLAGKKVAAPVSIDPYSNWLDRMQRARARHAAITKNLYTWSNYKNWADQMRDSWDDDQKK